MKQEDEVTKKQSEASKQGNEARQWGKQNHKAMRQAKNERKK
jgi:hypothetical protein